MSHFSVMVLTREGQCCEDLLLPYQETDTGEYAEFTQDESCDVDEVTGERGYWGNPDAKWDWWELGGRFRGMLKATEGKRGEYDDYADGRYDSAFLRDCDFTPSGKDYDCAVSHWESYVESGDGMKPDLFHWMSPDQYVRRYGTKEVYAKCKSAFHTWAVVTPDGEWHECGGMRWWGISTESDEEAVDWALNFFDRFLKGRDADLTVSIIDCHI